MTIMIMTWDGAVNNGRCDKVGRMGGRGGGRGGCRGDNNKCRNLILRLPPPPLPPPKLCALIAAELETTIVLVLESLEEEGK